MHFISDLAEKHEPRQSWMIAGVFQDKTPLLRALSPLRESPAVKAGLIRVYVIVNNYRTNFDDFREVYLFGSQVDR